MSISDARVILCGSVPLTCFVGGVCVVQHLDSAGVIGYCFIAFAAPILVYNFYKVLDAIRRSK